MIALYITKWGYLNIICLFQIILFLYVSTSNQDSIVSIPTNGHNVPFQRHMISSQYITITDFEAKVGYILSPNYPLPHPINSSSLLSLVAYHDPEIDVIRLTFEDLNLQTSNFCESEAIDILLGENSYSTVSANRARKIYTICGTFTPKPIIISTKNLFIQLMSDSFNLGSNRGFKMKFEFLNSRTQLHNGCPLPDHFRCRNRNCIPNQLKCNKYDDCGDASDEDSLTPCGELPTISYSIDYECGLASPSNTSTRLRHQLQYQPKSQQNNEASKLTNRIVGGRRVDRSNGWPFQVSIQSIRTEPMSHICGGTLIHPMFILSAAHCFKGLITAADYKFVLGSRDLRVGAPPEANGSIQIRYANSISVYPGGAVFRDLEDISYRSIDMTNDLALIELNAPVRLTSNVWPACLPHLSEPVVVYRECLASGYGDTRGTGYPYRLKQVEQVIAHSSNCRSVYSNFSVDDYTMICVRNKFANGPCTGDSGGPLFCADGPDNFAVPIPAEYTAMEPLRPSHGGGSSLKPGDIIQYLPISDNDDIESNSKHRKSDWQARFTVHGVTSFTTAGNYAGGYCGLEEVPTIYARVSTKVEWILSKMKTSMFRLSEADSQQDRSNRGVLFGYMFRSGFSRHENYTRSMTIYPSETVAGCTNTQPTLILGACA